jgi:hypothetical protein
MHTLSVTDFSKPLEAAASLSFLSLSLSLSLSVHESSQCEKTNNVILRCSLPRNLGKLLWRNHRIPPKRKIPNGAFSSPPCNLLRNSGNSDVEQAKLVTGIMSTTAACERVGFWKLGF